MLFLRPSVWTFARCWLASRCPSPSPWRLGPTSPSPWTPGGRQPCLPQRRRRNKLHQPCDAMPGEENSFCRKNLLHLHQFLKKELKLCRRLRHPCITIPLHLHLQRGAKWSLSGRGRCPPSTSWTALTHHLQSLQVERRLLTFQRLRMTLFFHTTVVTIGHELMTVKIKVCLPVTTASTCGEQRMKLTIVNAQPIMIAHRTVYLSMLSAKIVIVTYRPVWPAVSAQDYHPSIYLLVCIHWCHLNKNDLLTY